MNNISYISYLDQTVAESPVAPTDTGQTFSGTLLEDFSAGNSTGQHQPTIQQIKGDTPHNDDSLFSTYLPANRNSIMPIHQLLF